LPGGERHVPLIIPLILSTLLLSSCSPWYPISHNCPKDVVHLPRDEMMGGECDGVAHHLSTGETQFTGVLSFRVRLSLAHHLSTGETQFTGVLRFRVRLSSSFEFCLCFEFRVSCRLCLLLLVVIARPGRVPAVRRYSAVLHDRSQPRLSWRPTDARCRSSP